MPLAELERLFQAGLTSGAQDILGQVRGNGRADAATMFGVYEHAYWARLIESLGIDFPGLKAFMGHPAFATLIRRYIARHPSTNPSIRWAGIRLPDFLSAEAPYRADPWLADMARFDWALAYAFDAADAPAIGLPVLAALPPESWATLTLKMHPSLDAFPATTAVDEVRPLVLADASASFDRKARRDGGIMVWRVGLDVKFRAIDRLEFQALDLMRCGLSFGELCAWLEERVPPENAALNAAQFLRGWLDWGVIADCSHGATASA